MSNIIMGQLIFIFEATPASYTQSHISIYRFWSFTIRRRVTRTSILFYDVSTIVCQATVRSPKSDDSLDFCASSNGHVGHICSLNTHGPCTHIFFSRTRYSWTRLIAAGTRHFSGFFSASINKDCFSESTGVCSGRAWRSYISRL